MERISRFFDWRYGFSLDLRSLALFRIAFGFCLFLDLTYRLFYLDAFYTDSGVLPRSALLEKFLNPWEISFHLISGLWGVQFVLFLIGIIASLGLMFGYFTRVSAFVSWIFVCSMQVRAHVILHGGDDVFRLMLFWAQFLPLSAEWSVDKWRNKTPSLLGVDRTHHISVGTVGILIQLTMIYFFTALLKWHPVWHSEGSAVYYALHLDQFASVIGLWLRDNAELMRMMTFATLALEFLGPISVLMPLRHLNFRMLVALSFISFHLGLALTMELGLFPWVCISCWFLFFPPYFWDWLEKKNRQGFWNWLHPLRDFLLENRQMLRMSKWPMPPRPVQVRGLFNQCIGTFFLIIILYWNMTHFEALNLKRPPWLWPFVAMTETYQKWSMFAPFPRKDDGWYVMQGELFNGEKVNLWPSTDPFSLEKPKVVAKTYINSMWRKYLTNIWLSSHNDYRLYFGRYLCRVWNKPGLEKSQQLNTVHINYMLENTPLPGQPFGEIKKELVWRHYCFAKPENWE